MVLKSLLTRGCLFTSTDSGVYTCQTCNTLFTCLQYFQQHRKQHAKTNGISLLCCNHCPYSTENQFHYNWHIMSHTGEEVHTCSACNKPEEEIAVPSSSAAVKVEDDEEEEENETYDSIGRRSVATATNEDDLLLLESSGSHNSHDEYNSYYDQTSYSPSQQFHPEAGLPVADEEDEAVANGEHDITDEEDDEEEEIESEEDDTVQYQPEPEIIQQGPPYTKAPNAEAGFMPDVMPNPTRGRGKGNRKSRAISSGGENGEGELRRKFHCSHCGKSFKTKSHLQRHILTHTGEKPYHCNRCGSKFNQSSSLRNHIIAIHTKEYPHYCPHCNKGFLMPALLSKHLSTSHRTK